MNSGTGGTKNFVVKYGIYILLFILAVVALGLSIGSFTNKCKFAEYSVGEGDRIKCPPDTPEATCNAIKGKKIKKGVCTVAEALPTPAVTALILQRRGAQASSHAKRRKLAVVDDKADQNKVGIRI